MSNREPNNVGALVAGIVAVLLIAVAIWYFGTREGDDDVDININIPEMTTP